MPVRSSQLPGRSMRVVVPLNDCSSMLTQPDGSRDRRIEDLTNVYIVHLTARALLPLALRLRVPANAVSLSGLLFGAAGAGAFYRWHDWRYASLGLLLSFLWMIADGLDGMIARATCTTSAFGRFLDGVCDHVVFVLLYCALAASIGTASAWALAVAAGAAHAVQATLYEGERTRFHRRLRGEAVGARLAPSTNPLVRAYDGLANSFDRWSAPLEAHIAQSANPTAVGAEYAQRVLVPMRLMSLLTNNARVLTIFFACLVGEPKAFWWAELTVQTVILLFGLTWLRSTERNLVQEGST